ncbi:hypothetical protein MEQU1_002860 [Malassezia equina]|uniref:SAC3/GANP/THP3 conserved domain-containing protein n=1 Tax=Malassezia equina TaxID=1381935 RepID=A0AAF0EEL3_9BASI|nr:hypothetical protein MEQU1_002860 [Malassezia equina]
MASPRGDWPPALRYVAHLTHSELASQAFGACTNANRTAVSNELKALIFQAVQDGSLHTKDWRRVRLTSLEPKGKRRITTASPLGNVREEEARREKRQRRFEAEQAAFEREQAADRHSALASTSLAGRLLGQGAPTPPRSPFTPDPNVIDWDAYTVVGTSTKLEKPYLRLTSAPDPKTVRPLSTLRETLALLKRKWAQDGNYAYICDQFKSMRQDLTVQRIKNEFTVQVYETHARIALERGDLGEYNQCQSQLRTLYALGLPGAVHEFLAYRILYLLHTRHQRDVHALMTEMTPDDKAQPAVRHALAVRAALRAGNYAAFFQLYQAAPNMNARVMDHFVDRERVQALLILARSMRPSCTLRFVALQLGCDSIVDADQFLRSVGAAYYIDSSRLEEAQWDTKKAQEALIQAADKFRKVDRYPP